MNWVSNAAIEFTRLISYDELSSMQNNKTKIYWICTQLDFGELVQASLLFPKSYLFDSLITRICSATASIEAFRFDQVDKRQTYT